MGRTREALAYAALPFLFFAAAFLVPVVTVVSYALGLGDRPLAALLSLLAHPLELVGRFASAFSPLHQEAYYRGRILFTFQQAVASTLLTLAAGLPLAYLFSHHRFPLRRFLRAAFTVPFVLPAIVVALAFHAAAGPRGVLGLDLLTPLGPYGAILLAHVFYNVSLVLRVVGNFWERLAPEYAEAARTLGAGPWRTLWRIELPLVRPAIIASALLVFVFTLTSFGVILLLGSDGSGRTVGTIETTLYEDLRGFLPRYSTAAALALLQLAITYVALVVLVALQRRVRVPLARRPTHDLAPLPVWGWPLLSAATVFILGPPLALLASTFRSGEGWSLRAWRLLSTNEVPLGPYTALDAVRNSLLFAALTLVLALTLAWFAAYAAQRARHAAWAEAILLLPLGLSSVVVGLGFLLAWDGAPFPDLRTQPARIVLAHVLIAFPFASRILAPTLEAIPGPLREAARTLGASPFGVMRRLDLPLSLPALGVAAIYAFGVSLGEFGAVLVLRRPETTTLPLAIYDGFNALGLDRHAQANALAALLLLVALGGFLLLERLRPRTGADLG